MIFELLAISLIINIIVFFFAFFLQTDKLTDLTYSATFIILTVIQLFSHTITWQKILVVSFITIWGLRLGTYLAMRIHRIGTDKRFDEMRPKFFLFLGFWLLQGVAVWVISIASLLYLQLPTTQFDIMTIIGIIIWLTGFFFEAVGDYQMNAFYKIKRKKTEFIKTGLWKLTRHPNYFGEILCWFGIYFIAISSLPLIQSIYALASPIFISIVIIFLTGLPQNEAAREKKYGKLDSYKEYKKNTPVLIPGLKL